MNSIGFAGRQTSRLGFGCGRLVGGAALKSSRRIVEEALALGIRHFDVAPAYGMGLAEDVLGDVLASNGDVTIATKVGIGRPTNAGARSLARQFLKPLLSATPGLKAKLARHAGGGSRRGLFLPEQIESSLTESLRRLRRDTIEGLLLHQPESGDLSDATEAAMQGLLMAGRVRAVGSGTGGAAADLVPFGTIRQFRFDFENPDTPPIGTSTVLHGIIRRYPAPVSPGEIESAKLSAIGRDPRDPASWVGMLLTFALASRSDSIILISSTSETRLRRAVRAVDWAIVANPQVEALATMRELIRGANPSL